MQLATRNRDQPMVGMTLPEGLMARPATLDDLPRAVTLANASDRSVIGMETRHETPFRARWTAPYGNLETDSLVIETAEGTMAAFGHIHAGPPFIEAWANCKVHPDWRGRGLGSALMTWAEQRARVLTEPAPDDALTTIGAGVYVQDEAAAALLRDQHFTMMRHFVRMSVPLDRPTPVPKWSEGVSLRSVDPETQDRSICLAHEEAFRDHWGYVDRPDEECYAEWQHWCSVDREIDHDLWFVAWDRDEIAGMSICWPTTQGDASAGYVGILCVRRPWRGRGLGLALLHHTYREFAARGKQAVSLHADGENITGALRLYRRSGMEIDLQTDYFEKVLRPGRDLRRQSLDE